MIDGRFDLRDFIKDIRTIDTTTYDLVVRFIYRRKEMKYQEKSLRKSLKLHIRR